MEGQEENEYAKGRREEGKTTEVGVGTAGARHRGRRERSNGREAGAAGEQRGERRRGEVQDRRRKRKK